MSNESKSVAVPEENKMGVMPVGRLLFSMSLPMMLSMLVQALYNIVDSIFVAKLSEDALSAVSLAFPLQTLIFAVGGGTCVGVNALLSRALGEKDFKKANDVAMNGAFLTVLSYVVFLILGLTVVKPFYVGQLNGTSSPIYGMGVDYPGWHIECTGISLKYLGEHLDIHCGGIDNAFPHHTNEIAQSESYIGHHWCNYWMHVMHLNTASGKMSKSKGEFLTVSLLEQKGYDPLCYRLFCLQSHYRRNLVFTWDNLDNAAGTYQKLLTKIAALKPGDGEIDEDAVAVLREKFNAALGNDLNTSLAITALYDVLKYKTNDATKLFVLDDFDKVLSLDLCKKADEIRKRNAAEKPAAGAYSIFCEDGNDDPAVTAQIQARYDAKKAKNFAEADRIRDELKSQGVEITDIPGGVKWKHI